mgnify:CR=1 FL=1
MEKGNDKIIEKDIDKELLDQLLESFRDIREGRVRRVM